MRSSVGFRCLTFELRGSPAAWRAGQQAQNGAQAPALDGQCDMPLGLPLERRVRPHTRRPVLPCVPGLCEVHRMRTNIEIDDNLMKDALRATGVKTKREAVEMGLKTLVQLQAQEKARDLRGKITWEGNLDAMRTDR
jgi:Arc/MetJ family transcription regulator